MSKNLTPKSKIEQLIEKLRSPDKSERKQAKTQLLASGSVATAPLLDLLIELAHHPYPRFQIGEEEDGEAALERVLKLQDAPEAQGEGSQTGNVWSASR